MKLFRRKAAQSAPKLSVIVVMYNMRREAKRTLLSLSAGYQQGVDPDDYEVIVVDNNSSEPLDGDWVRSFGPNFRYEFLHSNSPSPVGAIKRAASLARGDQLGMFIDGARILTPTLLKFACAAAAGFEEPVVATLNWLLGPKPQHESVLEGYNQQTEDRMIAEAGWPEDPYALHRISVLGGSTNGGYFYAAAESNGIFVSRRLFDQLGGYDERFVTPGGGLVNLDFYRRACEAPGTELVVLLGEGTFHQIHGGIMTNAPSPEEKQARRQRFDDEYRSIRGKDFKSVRRDAVYLGSMPDSALDTLQFSVGRAIEVRNAKSSQ